MSFIHSFIHSIAWRCLATLASPSASPSFFPTTVLEGLTDGLRGSQNAFYALRTSLRPLVIRLTAGELGIRDWGFRDLMMLAEEEEKEEEQEEESHCSVNYLDASGWESSWW